MKKPRLIVLMGTVGSGKSTQVKLLASELRKKGLKVKTVSMKTNHLFAHFLSLILAWFLIKSRKDPRRAHVRALVEDRPEIFRKVFELWIALDLFSILIRFLLTIFLPMRLGYTVLVEDYIPATIADYAYFSEVLGFSSRFSSFVVTVVSMLIPAASSTKWVFLDAEESMLNSRWKNRRSIVEKPDYLQMQRNRILFQSKALSSCEVLYIDTTDQSVRDTHDLIVG